MDDLLRITQVATSLIHEIRDVVAALTDLFKELTALVVSSMGLITVIRFSRRR
jgi:hypothetical protein